MSRYTGPRNRINRREGSTVLGRSEKWKKRTSAPGMFPFPKNRTTAYHTLFREKQKVKRTYGMTERQFRKFYKIARKSTGNTGTRLLQLLEMRADNVLYRAGFGNSLPQVRQLVNHGHVYVNGKKHDIPSTVLNVGDEISFTSKFKKSPAYKVLVEDSKVIDSPEWIEKLSDGAKIKLEPSREMIDPSIKERLIIELYSK